MYPGILRSCFICDEPGNIIKVITDDVKIFSGNMPNSFLELFEPENLPRAHEFWRDLMMNSTVFSRTIPVSLSSVTGNAVFNGIVGSKEISIVVSYGDARAIPEIGRNELVNLQQKITTQKSLIDSLSKKLEANDQKFQILTRAINDAIWDWNILDDTIQWNQRLSAIYGYPESQFPGTLEAWAANIHPEDRAEAVATLQNTIAKRGLNWKFLYRYKSFNGIYKYTFDRGCLVYSGDKAIRMISVMQDIDERMTSLQEIEKLSLVASKTDNLVIITDATEKIEWVNEGFIKKTGYTLNEVIGKTPRFMQGPETDRGALKIIRQHIDAKQSVTQEILNYTKDGSKFWIKMNINPVFDDRDELVKFVAIETDVTPHKEYESKITAIATDLTNLLATVNAPVFGIDNNGYVNEWNNLASDLTGYRKNDILGKKLVETIVAENSREQISHTIAFVFQGNPLSNVELPIVSKSGKKIIILVNATPRKNAQNEVASVFLVGQDITELTRYRQSLEEKVKERTKDLESALEKEKELVSVKTRFASMVSHEFRTPLSTIKLSANHVKRYRSRLQPNEIDAKLDIIQEQVLHMTHMLEDVLTIGKSEAGKIEINKTRLNIRDFLCTLKSQVESQFKNSHTIHCSLDIVQPEIYSDPDLLRNIFINLLNNAIKFSPGKSDVYLKAHEDGCDIVFEVIDEGIGIVSSDADRIFNPFDRGTNTTSIPGTGLGLSITKKAVELLHGDITFRSTTAGTTFIFTLPKDRS